MPIIVNPPSSTTPVVLINQSASSMLQLIQQATGELGLNVPTYVSGNTTQDVTQQLALLNAVGYELQRQYDWQNLLIEYRYVTQFVTTTGTTTKGSAVITGIPSTTGLDNTYSIINTNFPQDTYISTNDSSVQVTATQAASVSGTVTLNFCKTKYEMPNDYDRPVDRTQWDKSKHWEMLGPDTSQQWQWLKSGFISSGPRLRFRVMGGYFQIWPPQAVADTIGIEYVSQNWVADSYGTGKRSFTLDTDKCIFPDQLMVLGLKKKYFEAKGFDATVLRAEYNADLSISKATDSGAPTLSFAPRLSSSLLGIQNVPDSGYG
jgi:hypothetical protein